MQGMMQLQSKQACRAGGFGPPASKQPAPSSRKRNDRLRQATKPPADDPERKQQERVATPHRADYLEQAMQASMRHMLNYDSTSVKAVPASALMSEQALSTGLDSVGLNVSSAAPAAPAVPVAVAGATAAMDSPAAKQRQPTDVEAGLPQQQELAAQVDQLLGTNVPLAFADKLASIVKGIAQDEQQTLSTSIDDKPSSAAAADIKADALTADLLSAFKGFSRRKSQAVGNPSAPPSTAQPDHVSAERTRLDVVDPVVLPPSGGSETTGPKVSAATRDWVDAWQNEPPASSSSSNLFKARSTLPIQRPAPGARPSAGQRLPTSKPATVQPTPSTPAVGTVAAAPGAPEQQAAQQVEPAQTSAARAADLGADLDLSDSLVGDVVKAALQGFEEAAAACSLQHAGHGRDAPQQSVPGSQEHISPDAVVHSVEDSTHDVTKSGQVVQGETSLQADSAQQPVQVQQVTQQHAQHQAADTQTSPESSITTPPTTPTAPPTPSLTNPPITSPTASPYTSPAPSLVSPPATWISEKAAMEADVKSLQQEVTDVLHEKKELLDQLLDARAQHQAEVVALTAQLDSMKQQLATARAEASKAAALSAKHSEVTASAGDGVSPASRQLPLDNTVQVAEVANALIGKVFSSSELSTQSKVEWGAELTRILQLLLAADNKTA